MYYYLYWDKNDVNKLGNVFVSLAVSVLLPSEESAHKLMPLNIAASVAIFFKASTSSLSSWVTKLLDQESNNLLKCQ